MKRAFQVGILIALVGAAFWLWTVLAPTPERAVRSRLNAFATTLSFKSGSGMIANALHAQKTADFFTPDVVVYLSVNGFEPMTVSGRDEVVQMDLTARTRLSALKVDFLDMNVTINPDGQSAKVNLTGKAVVPGERDISAQEFNFLLKKVDGKWLIYHIETVKTLAAVNLNIAS